MKKVLLLFVAIAGLAVTAYYLFFKEPVFKATNGYLVNVDYKRVGIDGYDPVSYFTDNKAMKGKEQFTAQFEGATYWFVSAEHAELFKAAPQQYAPQYGGFCGYAVSIGKLRPVDPTIYQIEDGRLILQHTEEAYRLFNKNVVENTVKADHNWPGIVAAHVGKPLEYDQPASPAAQAK